MACGAAVVASATGGIPEVVEHGETGLLVAMEQVTDGTGTPLDPEKFVTEFAAALTEVVSDPARARAMGEAGRRRAEEHFSWESITETPSRSTGRSSPTPSPSRKSEGQTHDGAGPRRGAAPSSVVKRSSGTGW